MLVPLQTAYVYGLKSGYLDAFLQGLTENGVPDLVREACPTRVFAPDPLHAVRATLPARQDFAVAARGGDWLSGLKTVGLSLTASINTSQLREGQVTTAQGVISMDITSDFKRWIGLVDRDALYLELLEWRRAQGWWNFAFDRAAIDAALASTQYQILGLPGMLAVGELADLERLQRLATTLVRRLFEGLYRRRENQLGRYTLVPATDSGIPDHYFKEISHGH